MYCTKCGTQNYDSSLKCVQCGDVLRRPQQFGAGAARTIEISNYLIQAILVTINLVKDNSLSETIFSLIEDINKESAACLLAYLLLFLRRKSIARWIPEIIRAPSIHPNKLRCGVGFPSVLDLQFLSFISSS